MEPNGYRKDKKKEPLGRLNGGDVETDLDPWTAWAYKPRTISLLLIGACFLIWASGALDPESTTSDDLVTSVKRGVWAMIAVFLAYSLLQAPSTVLIRPHPAIWRLVHGMAVIYLVALTFLLFQRRDDARQFMKFLHPDLGIGLLFSVLITAVITDAMKDAVGRPRPDFFWRCFPDGIGVFHNVTRDVLCTGDKSVVKEGHKSFPSGHTSWSFAGLGYLALYLSGKIRVFDQRGHVAKLCIVILPLLVAALVGVSRVDDYWHHWQDVFGGALIGLTVASFCYLQFFPPPYDPDGWGPHAYFQMLADSRNDVQNSAGMNHLNVREAELENVCSVFNPDNDNTFLSTYAQKSLHFSVCPFFMENKTFLSTELDGLFA